MCAIFSLSHIFHPSIFDSYVNSVQSKLFLYVCRKTILNNLVFHIGAQ
jgi:hypothetical protein